MKEVWTDGCAFEKKSQAPAAISIVVALPAAYAFSRYRFLGDKHLFFWLLSNRMAPAAVYALPFFNLYSALNLFDTPWAVALAHSGDPKTADSQIYICKTAMPALNGKHVVIGQVIKGMDVVDKLVVADVIRGFALRP